MAGASNLTAQRIEGNRLQLVGMQLWAEIALEAPRLPGELTNEASIELDPNQSDIPPDDTITCMLDIKS